MAAIDEHFAAARLWAVEAMPYLATALFALTPVQKPGLGTFGVDKSWRLYFDPATASQWTVEQAGAVLVHEVNHLLRDHAARSGVVGVGLVPGSAFRWNVAGDMEINDDLRGLPLPGVPLLPELLRLPPGDIAEYYYLHVGEVRAHDCGSGAHGQSRPHEDPPEAHPMVDDLEGELIRQHVAVQVRQAAAAGKHVPKGMERWASAFLKPKVDWRRELAAHVRASADAIAGGVDYSYRRPSRRNGTPIGRAVVFPALVQPVPRLAVVVDTSGSMDQDALDRALAEVKGLLRSGTSRSHLRVLACDTAVRATARVFSATQVQLAGGGGTDMGAGLAAAVAERPPPDVVVVLTDGYTPWPDAAPAAHVVVGLLGDGPAPPSWARLVRIPL